MWPKLSSHSVLVLMVSAPPPKQWIQHMGGWQEATMRPGPLLSGIVRTGPDTAVGVGVTGGLQGAGATTPMGHQRPCYSLFMLLSSQGQPVSYTASPFQSEPGEEPAKGR